MGNELDLFTLDTRVSRAAKALSKSVTPAISQGEPFGELRDVAGQSTYRALMDLKPDPFATDHKNALLRWVHELLQVRVGWDLVVAEDEAMDKDDPTLAPNIKISQDTSVLKTYAEALAQLTQAADAKRVSQALERLTDLASPVAAVRKEHRSRRFEVSRRLGLEHPWALFPFASSASASSRLARKLLDATEPLAVAQHKARTRREDVVPSPIAGAIDDAFARDARDGWPAHLNARWFEEAFRAILTRAPQITPDAFPSPIAAASFLRGAEAWGVALRLSGTARSLPFALSRDPYPVSAFALGGTIAMAVSDRVFAKRKLGAPARAADAHARALGRVLFFELRKIAASVACGVEEIVPTDLIEEMTMRVFGAPLERDLGMAWAASSGAFTSTLLFLNQHGGPEPIPPVRLFGAIEAFALSRSLVDRFDEDWFDNPKAGAHLASIHAGPVVLLDRKEEKEEQSAQDTQLASVVRHFEELIG